MALTQLTENLNVHQSLPDKPALTAEELKKEFDKAANSIKEYLNTTLTKELDKILEDLNNKDTTLQEASESMKNGIEEISSNIDSINKTIQGLKSGATTKISIGNTQPSSLENGEIYFQYFE